MKRLIELGIAVLLLTGFASGQAPGDPSALTVRIFSTHTMQRVTITPLNSSGRIQKCPQCKELPFTSPLTLNLMQDGLHISSAQKPQRQFLLSGLLRITTEDPKQTETAAGQWTTIAEPDGIRVLLTISTEHYVMAALNGEAAADEPLESLKALAVATRTFALVNRHRHAAENFDLCDSTHCQALRFGTTRPEIEQAVRATTGETLWYGARRANTYMTQHCGGQTEDAANVWPGQHASYLLSHPDPYCLRRSAAKWQTTIGVAEAMKIFREEHWNLPAHIDSIQISKRTSTGRAQLLAIIGADKKVSISASSLRFALNRALGWNQLRSDWYDVTLNNGMIHFEGKGYGHGVGLCQAGAFEMATEGHGYRDILSFYYPGTEVRITSADTGWKETIGAGWELISASPSHHLLTAGNAAWEKALALFPPKAQVHPRVHLMPSTELFRQTTDEPGWMLASTRGSDVFLQPSSILLSHEGAGPTLLHEFLHVLIEQETTQQTPLWLREGMVEALAENSQRIRVVPPMSMNALESALAQPTSEMESQHAHLASGVYVQHCIDQYGFAVVRAWLHSGVPATVLTQLH